LQFPFQDSVDDYLAFCEERGEEPEKPYSGRFVIRTDPGLHKKIAFEAKKKGKSLNLYVNEALADYAEAKTEESDSS